jgi:hypothetical protein
MYGVVPYIYKGLRLVSYCKHGRSLDKMQAFAQGIQNFTIASVPFVEIRDRQFLDGSPSEMSGYSFHHKVIITFRVDGDRFGFPIYGPRDTILEDADFKTGRGIRAGKKVIKSWGDYFAQIYPAENVEFETGWLCR